jgi:bacterioferritin
MKGNETLISKLNELLAEELTAVNQYMVHSEMCDNWGYQRLHKKVEGRAIQEMKHAERLIARILFLEGLPKVDHLNKITIGAGVEQQLNNDLQAEYGAVKAYNQTIHLAEEVSDGETRELLEDILGDEDEHVDWLEAQLDQVKQMGLQLYLSNQVKE